MKTLAAGLQDHLDTRSTTMALCWQVVRKDGVVQGFTEHDEDISFAFNLDFVNESFLIDTPVTYEAATGFTSSRIAQTLGLSPDNLNVDGAISSDSINEADLAAGYYDDAAVILYWVNWQDVSERIVLDRGNIGEVARMQTAFSAEFRSLTDQLGQQVGQVYQRTCDAVLGDTRCGVDLTSASYKETGTITSASGRDLIASGIASFDDDFFTHGVMTFTSGSNDGLSFAVKSHIGTSIVLWEVPPETVSASDTFEITAGCDHTFATCKAKFLNAVNFRGFPLIPGNDIITTYASNEDQEMDGGSYFQ